MELHWINNEKLRCEKYAREINWHRSVQREKKMNTCLGEMLCRRLTEKQRQQKMLFGYMAGSKVFIEAQRWFGILAHVVRIDKWNSQDGMVRKTLCINRIFRFQYWRQKLRFNFTLSWHLPPSQQIVRVLQRILCVLGDVFVTLVKRE